MGKADQANTTMEDQAEFPVSAYFTGFLKQVEDQDGIWWALVDFEGEIVFKSRGKLHCFAYAMDKEVTVLSVH